MFKDHVFRQIGLSLSFPNPPPIVVLDMRPFFWVMCLVFSHDVAEQVARASKQWPHSTPKSPTMEEYVAIIGSHSIIAAQVRCAFLNHFSTFQDQLVNRLFPFPKLILSHGAG